MFLRQLQHKIAHEVKCNFEEVKRCEDDGHRLRVHFKGFGRQGDKVLSHPEPVGLGFFCKKSLLSERQVS